MGVYSIHVVCLVIRQSMTTHLVGKGVVTGLASSVLVGLPPVLAGDWDRDI